MQNIETVQPTDRQSAAKGIENNEEPEEQLVIVSNEPPKRRLVEDSEFNFDQPNENSLRVMAGFNQGYLMRLKDGIEKQQIEPEHRKADIIFRREFELEHFKLAFEFYFHRSSSVMKACLSILRRSSKKKIGIIELNIFFFERSVWKSEQLRPRDSEKTSSSAEQYWFLLYSIDKYLDQRSMFMDFKLKYRQKPVNSNTKRYCGLDNVGNTCYMNSFLQTLFFIKPLRRMILDCNAQKSAFVGALQRTFADMTLADGSVVNPETIVRASEWSRDFLFNQQDIDEFKRHVFEEVEKVNKGILSIFQVESISTVQCKDVDYRNDSVTTSLEIQLNIMDHKRNKLETIEKSLDFFCREEQLESEVDTEKYGHKIGYKTVKFTKLPSVLFLNLKRYEFETGQMHKLMSKFVYTQHVDFKNFVGSKMDSRYVLYGVLVHRGQSTASGHYYSFINTSSDASKPEWYKFNDSIVTEVDESEAIEDNYGGVETAYRFSKEGQKFIAEQAPKMATAYILVYIRESEFSSMQMITPIVPKALQRLSGSTFANANGVMNEVVVVLANNLIEQTEGIFSPKVFNFGKAVTLDMKDSLAMQMGIITAGCDQTEGTLWRISLTNRSVTNLQRQYCNQILAAKYMLFGDHPQAVVDKFYILFVPSKFNCDIEPFRLSHHSANNDLAIAFVVRSWDEQDKYRRALESIAVFRKDRKQSVLGKIMASDHTDRILFRKGKVLNIESLEFTRKEMYCEVALSYIRIDLQQHDEHVKKPQPDQEFGCI